MHQQEFGSADRNKRQNAAKGNGALRHISVRVSRQL
jgi:hypothetical protein